MESVQSKDHPWLIRWLIGIAAFAIILIGVFVTLQVLKQEEQKEAQERMKLQQEVQKAEQERLKVEAALLENEIKKREFESRKATTPTLPSVPLKHPGDGVGAASSDPKLDNKNQRLEDILASVPTPYRDYLKEHPGWLTAEQSADFVYLAAQRKLLVIAVGSSPLNKSYPRDACELKALAAAKTMSESRLVEWRKLEPDGNATKSISQFVEGGVKGLPVVVEWLSVDGQKVHVLYGALTEAGR